MSFFKFTTFLKYSARVLSVIVGGFWAYVGYVEQNILYFIAVPAFLAIMWNVTFDIDTSHKGGVKWSWVEYVAIGFGAFAFIPPILTLQKNFFPNEPYIANLLLGCVLGLTMSMNISYITLYRLRKERILRSVISEKIYADSSAPFDSDLSELIDSEYHAWAKVRMSTHRKILLIRAGVPASEAKNAKNFNDSDIDLWGSFTEYAKRHP